MSDTSAAPVGERPRKRVRKGTRSCWECKRRKIKCNYQPEDQSICAGCRDKGTTCLSQEFVEDQRPRDVATSALDQRMGRVEMLLEKMMEKVLQSPNDSHTASSQIGDLTVSSTPTSIYDSRPQFVSLFDDDFGQHGEPNISIPTPQSIQASHSNRLTSTSRKATDRRIEKLREELTTMLPCQEDIDYLSDSSHGWWLLQRHMLPHLLRIPESEVRKRFDVSMVSISHPMVIARLLLCVALCIQQLPPNANLPRLRIKIPLPELMEKIIIFVTTAVTSDDELTGSLEGVECFALQGLYQVMAGNFRRGWLAFRKAINVAQLMGLHRVSLKSPEEIPDPMEARRHYMWFQLMQEERYISLTLGVPSATSSTPFPFDDHAPWLSTEGLYHKHLCRISGLILARNQGDATHAFSTTQEINEELDSLAKKMPQSWWDIPTSLIDDRTDEASIQSERMMCHLWHFEFQQLVHLPFMLRAATDRRYEYSRVSCLSACRSLIKRWMFIRSAYGTTLFSSLIEFQAFTTSITLLLGLLGLKPTTDTTVLQERQEDLQLIETVVQIFEGLKQFGTGLHIINQSISVIHTLLSIVRNEGNSPGVLRLSIPHFGTISVARGGAVRSIEGERILGANPRSQETPVQTQSPIQALRSPSSASTSNTRSSWSTIVLPKNQNYQAINNNGEGMTVGGAGVQNTVLQFTSSQFPTFDSVAVDNTTGWSFQESDMMFFDSLLNTDVAGNWEF